MDELAEGVADGEAEPETSALALGMKLESAEGSGTAELKIVGDSAETEDTTKVSVGKKKVLSAVGPTAKVPSEKTESENSTCRMPKGASYVCVATAVVIVVLRWKMMTDWVIVIGSTP